MDFTAIKTQAAALLALPGLAESFTLSGKTFTGVRSVLKRQDRFVDVGLAESYEFSLLCGQAQFTTQGVTPLKGMTLVLGAKTYRLLTTETDPLQASVRLNLGGQYQ